jgi:hypothetical protein
MVLLGVERPLKGSAIAGEGRRRCSVVVLGRRQREELALRSEVPQDTPGPCMVAILGRGRERERERQLDAASFFGRSFGDC